MKKVYMKWKILYFSLGIIILTFIVIATKNEKSHKNEMKNKVVGFTIRAKKEYKEGIRFEIGSVDIDLSKIRSKKINESDTTP